MYSKTKAAALEDTEKNKFLLKGRYKSEGGDGIFQLEPLTFLEAQLKLLLVEGC